MNLELLLILSQSEMVTKLYNGGPLLTVLHKLLSLLSPSIDIEYL